MASIPMQAQDLIAVQAPIDRKLKVVDSVALQRLIETDELEMVRGYIHHGITTLRIVIRQQPYPTVLKLTSEDLRCQRQAET